MRKISFLLLALVAFFFSGCSSLWHGHPHHHSSPATPPPAPAANSQHYFIDPSVEMRNYKTYGFLQVTAVRYQDPAPPKDAHKGFWSSLFHTKSKKEKEEEERPTIHYTDELIWRVLQDEMQRKGYAQVAPNEADLLIVYYGGPRPQTPPDGVRVQPSEFDDYFAQHELHRQTFFIDVIDTHQDKLIYRGWDNSSFYNPTPPAETVMGSVKNTIGFFPSKL